MSGKLLGGGRALQTVTVYGGVAVSGIIGGYNDVLTNGGQRPVYLYHVRTMLYGAFPTGDHTFWLGVTDSQHKTVRDILGLITATNSSDTYRTELEWTSPIMGYGYEVMAGDVVTVFYGTAILSGATLFYGFAVYS